MCSSKILIKNKIQHGIANTWRLGLWPFQITIEILFVLLTLNKWNFKSRCSTDSKWGILMHWLGNISSQIYPKEPGKASPPGHILFCFLSYYSPCWRSHSCFLSGHPVFVGHLQAGTCAEQALWVHPKARHSGCALLGTALSSVSLGRAGVPCSPHGFTLVGMEVFLNLRWLLTEVFFQSSEDKVQACRIASQFLWQLSTAAWLETINPLSPGQAASPW